MEDNGGIVRDYSFIAVDFPHESYNPGKTLNVMGNTNFYGALLRGVEKNHKESVY